MHLKIELKIKSKYILSKLNQIVYKIKISLFYLYIIYASNKANYIGYFMPAQRRAESLPFTPQNGKTE